jgi:hypothetical protein
MNANDEAQKVSINVTDRRDGAKPVSDVTEHWFGTAPHDLQAGITSLDLPRMKTEEIVDKEITVLGFQKRTGKIKGKETEYVLALCAVEGIDDAQIVTMGGAVVFRKLNECADSENLPVKGHIVERTSKGGVNYYDFIG